jgi:hypothetical protein
VFQLTPSIRLLDLPPRRILVFALLLTVAQLFAQLHALEHLNDLDEGQYADEACALCILSAGLDAVDSATLATSDDNRPSSALVENSLPFVAAYSFIAFTGRAPPVFSSTSEIH